MIRPPGFGRVRFGTAAEGDARSDHSTRRVFVDAGAPSRWVHANQVHGVTVAVAERDGSVGDADAIFTDHPGLSLVVATADCVPIALEGDGFAAVVHAGWRGVAADVVDAACQVVSDAGFRIERAAIGPAIGPCCYEVGEEVRDALPGHHGVTTWGTPSVDLVAAVTDQLTPYLAGGRVWSSGRCTFTDPELNSYRRDRTSSRQVVVAWSTDE